MARVVGFDLPVADTGRTIAFEENLTGQDRRRLPVGADDRDHRVGPKAGA